MNYIEPPHIEEEVWNNPNAAFNEKALALFNYQYQHNALYAAYCRALHIRDTDVHTIEQIPFLPISFFKSHRVVSGNWPVQLYFESSGTTGTQNSRHWIKDVAIYKKSFTLGFEQFYCRPQQYCIIGLLPSYLQQGHSSLVYMVNELISISGVQGSGFYLDEWDALQQQIQYNEKHHIPTLLIGVTYALLHFAEQYPQPLKNTIVMETGGMKGRRKEITREEVHAILQKQWQLDAIHSEYGMTELLSQAYSSGKGIFFPTATMKVLIRATDDPFDVAAQPPQNKASINGAINIIDLANIYSCAFIATEDLGRLYTNSSFEPMGRIDNSDIRGCSLLAL